MTDRRATDADPPEGLPRATDAHPPGGSRRASQRPGGLWRGMAVGAVVVGIMLVVAGCAGAGGTATPTASAPTGTPLPSTAPSRTPSTIPAGPVTTPDEAAALVIASDPRFADIRPYNPDLIGQAAWWTAVPAADGFIVTIRIGWGDCQAGCIDERIWRYSVTTDGTITLLGESGDEYSPGDTDGTTGAGTVTGRATAGPVCPVEQVPPDPACADRPVEGAVIVVRDIAGNEVARAITGAGGRFTLDLPNGRYTLEPQPVEGLLGTAAPVEVTLKPGGALALVELSYDTGIR